MQGYIKLYRELMDKPIWLKSTPEQKTILITLLLMANHAENEWEWQGEKFKVEPGQFVTSIEGIAQRSGKGISTQNVRTALNKFEKYEFLTNQSTKTGRLITIVNWECYQSDIKETNKDINKDLTKRSQRPNKDLTPNKNDKNDNNDKNERNIYKVIFDYWNGKGIVGHRSLSSKLKNKIIAALKDYEADTLMAIIDTYAEIVLGEQYWFTHKWTLEDFLQRGLSKFEDRQIAIQNYLKEQPKVENPAPKIIKPATKFHNFEQRSSKYSPDELEKLVMGKKPG